MPKRLPINKQISEEFKNIIEKMPIFKKIYDENRYIIYESPIEAQLHIEYNDNGEIIMITAANPIGESVPIFSLY